VTTTPEEAPMAERLTRPQRELLAEIAEAGVLYITRNGRYHRTVEALERRGLVYRSEPDYSTWGQSGWSLADTREGEG
jgi:hypothetical protein